MSFRAAQAITLVQLSILLLSSFIVLGQNLHPVASPAHPPSHHHGRHHHHHHHHPPSHAPVHPPSHSPGHPPSQAPVHSPNQAPVHSPSHSPVHLPSHAPAHSPNHALAHSPNRSPVHPPSQAPAHSPSHSPVHPPTQAPAHSLSRAPAHPPSHHRAPCSAPVPSPARTPVHPPSHSPSPHAPPKSFVAVEGVVYCKSCKYSRVDTLVGASPLQGAIVKLFCNNTKNPVVVKAKTDKRGYFFIAAPKTITTSLSHKCRVSLVSSPLASCSKPTNFHAGQKGAILTPVKAFVTQKLPFRLYSVGPFAFEPKCGSH